MKKYIEPEEKLTGAASTKPKPKKKFKLMWRSKRASWWGDDDACSDPEKDEYWSDWSCFQAYSTEARRDQALEGLKKKENHGFTTELFQYKREEDT